MIKVTDIKNHYWTQSGAHQEQFEGLSTQIPMEGHAATLHGELIRCVSNLMHEYCANENQHAYQENWSNAIYNEHDQLMTPAERETVGVNPKFLDMLNFIKKSVCTPEVEKICHNIEEIIINSEGWSTFNDKDAHQYDLLVDHILFYIDRNPDVMFN